ncbi:hypothetical protein M378DRAFT_154883 [Amanita muscaria Koide BX008]|uniref:Uncharacterized protein n=1 Tax=Amanita muscaria (strain Koide BX008) TaxID=946122 RepID=A0A0C2XP03_AMAMK|nr:hypothetical protein M378DRAFT_154883 [Amanita muscaria Koide BX008]
MVSTLIATRNRWTYPLLYKGSIHHLKILKGQEMIVVLPLLVPVAGQGICRKYMKHESIMLILIKKITQSAKKRGKV